MVCPLPQPISTAPFPKRENAGLREAFLARGPEAIDYLEATTEVRLQPVKIYPDYYPEQPGATAGGRVLEPVASMDRSSATISNGFVRRCRNSPCLAG